MCPDLFFFQKATEFPCEEIMNVVEKELYQSLRKRVEFSQLNSAEIRRDRLGVTNVKSSIKKTEHCSSEYAYIENGEAHWEVVQRILYIFAKLNVNDFYFI